MGDIQFQISEPTFNKLDNRYYQRSRYVYDSDGDGVLESHGERIHSSDSEVDHAFDSEHGAADAAGPRGGRGGSSLR